MALSSQFSVRLVHLEQFSQALEQRKGCKQAFKALAREDQKKILHCLESVALDRNGVENTTALNLIKKEVQLITKEICGKTIDRLPRVLLKSILHYAWKSPGTTALICKAFNDTQKNSYDLFLKAYIQDPSLVIVTSKLNLTLGAIKKMSPEQCCQKIMEVRQRIKERDLQRIYTYLELEAMEEHGQLFGQYLPDYSSYDESVYAAQIGQWMKTNPIVLSNVKELRLATSNFRTIPPEIQLLPHLKTLVLYENAIEVVPSWIKNLNNLKELNLAKNQIKKMPKEVCEMRQLVSLGFSWNQLKKLPREWGQLTNLEHLYLRGNQLKGWPSSIHQLKKLKSFCITDNPLFTSDEILAYYLDYFSDHHSSFGAKGIQLLRKLFSKSSNLKQKQPVQDQFSTLVKQVQENKFHRFLQKMLFYKSLEDLQKAWKAPTAKRMILVSQRLPKELRYRIYAFTYFLEKRKGRHIRDKQFGRMAFRNEGKKLSDPNIRSQALQLTLLEIVCANILKKKGGEENSLDFLDLFLGLDGVFQEAIYENFKTIEKEKGQAVDEQEFGKNAFLGKLHSPTAHASRIQAIEQFLHQICS